MKSSVFLAIVHNNNQTRNSYIKPQIDSLVHQLEHFYHVEKIEVSFQGAVEPHSGLMAFFRDLIYFKLSCHWRHYRLHGPLRSLLGFVSFFRNSVLKYILSRHSVGQRWRKNSAIEVALSDKHIRAWSKFLDTKADWLICFEDDAVFKSDSISNIEKLLGQFTDMHCHKPLYIDLAGGCDLKDLQLGKLLEMQDECFRFYKKPVTNTTCVYMMNRYLVSEFHRILTRKPWIRFIGVDWMINNLFINIIGSAKAPGEVICMHADPTIFKHGTFTGEYVSWQAGSRIK